jgi:U32 family peptidase
MKHAKKRIEIMAPAGSWESLTAAINARANSIYFGIEQLNMRAKAANNFTLQDLPEISRICDEKGVKTYLTLNTILYNHDISLMKKICDGAKSAGITAIIAADVAAISYANAINLEVHISTQANISNVEAVKFYAKFADVVVLARELTIKQVREIHETILKENIRGPKGEILEIELFAHGALCVAISGKCYMSLQTYNSSANRGACRQNCRRSYKVIDEETGVELVVDNKYIMSPKDLCTIGMMDQIIDAGVTVFKLEGRGRSADYVDTVVRCYREAADSYLNNNYTQDKIAEWTKELETVYNRGLWHGGYYLGKQLGEWSGVYGSKATKERVHIGRAVKFFVQPSVGEFIIETKELKVGDDIIVVGPNTGVLKHHITSMRVDDKDVEVAHKGDTVTMILSDRIRKADKLFLVIDREKLQEPT